MLTKGQILAADDLRRVTVDVPEWGGQVVLRELCGRDLDAAQDMAQRLGQNSIEVGAWMIARSIIDPDTGQPLFGDEEATSLMDKNAKVIMRLLTEIKEINALNPSDVEALGKV